MDTEAFLPLSVEELTKLEVPRRLIGLGDLARDLGERAAALGIADTKGLNATHGWYSARRYLRIGPAGAWLGIDHKKWSRYGITPLWIWFPHTEYGRATFVLQALKAWAPPRLFQENGRALIPLTVSPDVTRERVLVDLLEQLKGLHAALQSAAAMATTALQ